MAPLQIDHDYVECLRCFSLQDLRKVKTCRRAVPMGPTTRYLSSMDVEVWCSGEDVCTGSGRNSDKGARCVCFLFSWCVICSVKHMYLSFEIMSSHQHTSQSTPKRLDGLGAVPVFSSARNTTTSPSTYFVRQRSVSVPACAALLLHPCPSPESNQPKLTTGWQHWKCVMLSCCSKRPVD